MRVVDINFVKYGRFFDRIPARMSPVSYQGLLYPEDIGGLGRTD